MKHTHGGDVYRYSGCIDFSANINPLGTPEGVKKAIVQTLDSLHDYPQVGCDELRKALSDYHDVPSEHIFCGNGAADVIFSLVRAVKPKKALVIAPTFAEYEQALVSTDCVVDHVYLEDDFSVTDHILRFLTPDIDLFFLCNPNNPTGLLTDRALLEKILKRCEEQNIRFILDECFLDFIHKEDDYTMMRYLADHPGLFILKAFTKRYGMAGVRLGYGLCSDLSLLDKMTEMTQPWSVSTMAQAAGIAALKETVFAEKGRQIVFEEAEYLMKEFDRLSIKYWPGAANYLFFKGPEDLFEKCVSHGILIRDCSNYPGLQKGYYRIAIKLHEENVKLIQTFEDIFIK